VKDDVTLTRFPGRRNTATGEADREQPVWRGPTPAPIGAEDLHPPPCGRADARTVAASAMDTGLPNPQVRLTWLASVAAHGPRVFARRTRPSSAP